ncbi:MAG: hypothetical protein HFE84_08180 [Lachnospiraceae bacterium]|nr:hypothetical protein [Lachnospiraceae bacterium]
MNFFGNDFQAWKLRTLNDYLMFFFFIFAGALIFVLLTKHMNRQRNHGKAVRKVAKKLRKLAKKPYFLKENVTLHLPEGDMIFDALLADKSGIYLVHAFGWGTKIFGTPDGETWRREDPKRKEEFPNPLFPLKKGAAGLTAILEAQGITRVKIMPMVVFADNYQTPELYLGYGSFSTTYQELKVWYRKQSGVKEAQYDFERVSSILMGIM